MCSRRGTYPGKRLLGRESDTDANHHGPSRPSGAAGWFSRSFLLCLPFTHLRILLWYLTKAFRAAPPMSDFGIFPLRFDFRRKWMVQNCELACSSRARRKTLRFRSEPTRLLFRTTCASFSANVYCCTKEREAFAFRTRAPSSSWRYL